MSFNNKQILFNIHLSLYGGAICCTSCERQMITDIVTDLFKCTANSSLNMYTNAGDTFPLYNRYKHGIHSPSQLIANNLNNLLVRISKCLTYRRNPSTAKLEQEFKIN